MSALATHQRYIEHLRAAGARLTSVIMPCCSQELDLRLPENPTEMWDVRFTCFHCGAQHMKNCTPPANHFPEAAMTMTELLRAARRELEGTPIAKPRGICGCLVQDAVADAFACFAVHDLRSAIAHALTLQDIDAVYYSDLYPDATCEQLRAGRLQWLDDMIAWSLDRQKTWDDFPPPPNPTP